MTRGLKSGAKSMEESDRPKLSSMYIFSAQEGDVAKVCCGGGAWLGYRYKYVFLM